MKLARFGADGLMRLGVLDDRGAVDLERARTALAADTADLWPAEPLVGGVQDVFAAGWRVADLERLADAASRLDSAGQTRFATGEYTLANPFPEHNRIITCRGLNPNTLWTQGVRQLPAYPTADFRTRYRLKGPGDQYVLDPWPADWDRADTRLSWNPELAVLIERTGTDIPRAEALAYVAGYFIFVDGAGPGTTRVTHGTGADPDVCIQYGTEPTYGPWRLDHPVGPWLTTADEVDPTSVEFHLDDSGTVIDIGSGRTLVFDVAEVVHFFSRVMTLRAGDIVTMSALGFDGLDLRDSYLDMADAYLRVGSPQLGDLVNPIDDRRTRRTPLSGPE